jgi:hypothetical protein
MKLLILMIVASWAFGATRVLDVIYNGSGQRANGVLTMEWPGYTTVGGKSVAGSRRDVRISNGVVDVLLEPTIGATPVGVVITARMTLFGSSVASVERWNVPDVAVTNLATLRLAPSAGAGQPIAGLSFEEETPTGIRNGINLVFTLTKVPLTGSLDLYRNGTRYILGQDYLLNAATRTITLQGGAAVPQSADTLRAKYMSGVGSVFATSAGNYVDSETPSGSVNGSNTAFQLTRMPYPATSLVLIRNGIVLSSGVDFTVSGSTISFVSGAVPQAGDILRAWYRW